VNYVHKLPLRGFRAKASRSKGWDHAAEPTPPTQKKAPTKKNRQKSQVKRLDILMEELSGLNRLVVQPKIAIKEQKEVIMMDGQTVIQKETFKLPNIQPF